MYQHLFCNIGCLDSKKRSPSILALDEDKCKLRQIKECTLYYADEFSLPKYIYIYICFLVSEFL